MSAVLSVAASRLSGKTILITGASSGIGRSIAFEFAQICPTNLRLILTARRLDKLNVIAEDIAKETVNGVKVLPVALDVSNRGEIQGFVGRLPLEWRDIHVLVNNAYVTGLLSLQQSQVASVLHANIVPFIAAWHLDLLELRTFQIMTSMSCSPRT